jgi:mannose-1-phosphate guanylyltransferase/phosphomannomutase
VPWYKKGAVMRKAMDYSNDMKRELIDGIKIFESESENVLILPDQEKGIFSIFAESFSAESVEALSKKYAELIHKWKLEN